MTSGKATKITPFIVVNDGKKAIDYYSTGFGAIELERHAIDDKRLMSKISIEGAEFWLSDEQPEFGNVSPSKIDSSAIRIVLNTVNADDIFNKAIHAGATQICPMTTEDEWRIGKLKDPFGHVWEIGYIL